MHNSWLAGWGSQATAGWCMATDQGGAWLRTWERTCTHPAPRDEATPPHHTLEGSSTTSGLGSSIPSSSIFPEMPGPLPTGSAVSTPLPRVHSHGGQAGQQIWAGCKTRAINYLLLLFLKISSQGNDPKEESKYKSLHNSSDSNSTAPGKCQPRRSCELRPTWGDTQPHWTQGAGTR